ncbi:MAG: FAD-binding protein [Rhodospirillales bacterium]|nr:MAG: FAD-binding protein [Rhodospirillales bacterium]
MSETFRPENAEQLRDVLAWAASESKRLEIIGSGSKRELGHPVAADHAVELAALSGISLYEPDELVLSAGPSTALAEVEAALAERNQQLDFEPPDYGPLLSTSAGAQGAASDRANVPAGTLGGALACNLSGPRRIKSGAARDHFLGFKAVSGHGTIFKSGGRVVKNVTGYDLSKLMAGSWGTLAVTTEVTVKVLPAPEKTRTMLLFGGDAVTGGRAMTMAMSSPYDVSGAAWLPASLSAQSSVELVSSRNAAVAAVRVEGFGPSVEYRCSVLREQLGVFGQTEELHTANSTRFWREIRDVLPFAGPGDDRLVWKISVPPAAGPAIVTELTDEDGADAFLDWAGGLVWLALPAGVDARQEKVRPAVERAGGHAMLFRAPAALRAGIPVFHPQPAVKAGLTRRIKAAFDPGGILNPGRMYPES